MRRILPAFADLSVGGKGLVVVSIPVIALLIVLTAVFLAEREEQAAEHLVRHTLEVRQDLQVALTLLIDAETGTRGYLLTGRGEWLTPYHNAVRRFPGAAESIAKLVADNPRQVARVRLMREIAGERLRNLVVLQGLGGRNGSAEMEDELVRGKASMDAVRGIFADMQAEEESLLAARTAHVRRARRLLYALIAAAVVAGLGGGLVGALLFGRHIGRRIRQLSGDAQALARREELPPPDSTRDEIGRLSGVLRETDRLLAQRERQLRETQTFLEHLVETSPTVIFRQDPRTLHVSYVSPNVERILGYTAAELQSEPDFWTSRIHPDDRQRVLEQDDRAFADHVAQLELEYRFRHKDGSYRWIDSFVRIEYGADGKPSEFLGHRLDISGRKQTEEALRERETSLNATNKELEAFSYSVSHDLRAPLRSIDGFSQAMMEDFGNQLDPSARSYLQRVRGATQRMGVLIDDLLNLSRVTRRPLQRQQVDLSGMAKSIAAELRRSEPERAADFVIARDLQDDCDANLIRVALENLLGNAWKFTSRHAAARIEFARRDGAYFVRDDGAGFDAAYKSKLFGAFQRLHHSNDFAGTGIGLATVQRIIHRHGGRVWAEGAPEKGATFYFTLHPASREPAA
jgi:PAS domain S-box-containing protein